MFLVHNQTPVLPTDEMLQEQLLAIEVCVLMSCLAVLYCKHLLQESKFIASLLLSVFGRGINYYCFEMICKAAGLTAAGDDREIKELCDNQTR